MSFIADLNGLTGARSGIQNASGEMLECLDDIKNKIVSLGKAEFSGKTAGNMLAYVNEFHGTAVNSLEGILVAFNTKLSLYVDGLMQLDENIHALIPEEDLNTATGNLQFRYNECCNIDAGLQSVLASICDLVYIEKPLVERLCEEIDYERSAVLDLISKIDSHETEHASDLEDLDTMITQLEEMVKSQKGNSRVGVGNYSNGMIVNMMDITAFSVAAQAISSYCKNVNDEFKVAVEHEKIIADTLTKEAADARLTNGIWSAVAAVGTVVVGVAAIVCTAGVATPAVVSVTAAVAGSGATLYGVSNLGEASQEIYYGAIEDIYSESTNIIRDTVFMGNQTGYDIWGTACTIVAGVSIPVGQAYGVASEMGLSGSQAAGLAARAAAVDIAKGVISDSAGAAVSEIVTDATGDENLGKIAGLGSSFAVGSGLDKIDSAVNISGLHPNVSDTGANLVSEHSVDNTDSNVFNDTDTANVETIGDGEASLSNSSNLEQRKVACYNDDGTTTIDVDYVDENNNIVLSETYIAEAEKAYRLPSEARGTWTGTRGNSEFVPNDLEMKSFISEYGVEGVTYTDGWVDFDIFANHTNTPYGDFDSTVIIENMSGDRTGAGGNYSQYFDALSEKLGVPATELKKYAKDNGYTVHECPDGKRAQLIPTKINNYFSHTGGTSYSAYLNQAYDFLGDLSHDALSHIHSGRVFVE